MSRVVCLCVASLLVAGAFAAEPPSADDIDGWVQLFSPDLLGGQHDVSTFVAPATDIAGKVKDNALFTFLVFVPFLVLPQILLLIAMFRFRDRGGERKPATFMHNTKLENAWTAIPVLTLFIVGVPVFPLLYEMDLPPKHADVVITVRGKSFDWGYDYKRENIQIRLDRGQQQEPVVLPKGKVVTLAITSDDVNHAWWVPAFGVKKDAIGGRFNNAWFTPTRTGFYKGQCAELCGTGHGIMLIGAAVVEPKEYDEWVALQHARSDTDSVFDTLEPSSGAMDQGKLAAEVANYFAKDRSPQRVFALRYWTAANYAALRRSPPNRAPGESDESFAPRYADFKKLDDDAVRERRATVDRAITAALGQAALAGSAPSLARLEE